MEVVVFIDQVSTSSHASSARELVQLESMIRQLDARVCAIPDSFDAVPAEDALCWLPHFDTPCHAVWCGFIPSTERYTQLYHVALAHNVHLINSPEQSALAMSFSRYYPHIEQLTARSAIVSINADDIHAQASALGYPLFVKGSIKSNKELGLHACVAHSAAELDAIITQLRARPHRTQGQLVLRKLLNLRTMTPVLKDQLPITREYRVFVLQNRVLSHGFYWKDTSVNPLSQAEEHAVHTLAVEVSRRLNVPYIAVDVAQRQDGSWCVIEVGDAQFMGLSQNAPLKLWQALLDVLKSSTSSGS